MDQAVKDRVGQRRITQGLMPVLDGQLAGDQRGPAIMAVFDDLQEVATVCITERREPPVIQDQQVGLGQGGQEFARASIAFRNRSFLEESGEPERAPSSLHDTPYGPTHSRARFSRCPSDR
jgi:hypothetical protein